MRLAVIIPALNEAATLAATLRSLRACRDQPAQVLVADGGSVDNTTTLAKEYGANVVVASRKGRGCQIAAALKGISEEIILIIHADMTVPPDALSLIQSRLASEPTCPGGCLGHKFNSPRRVYRIIEWWDLLRARKGRSYGDQAQFFRRDLLEREGGFPDQPIMEDLELSRRLMALGRPACLDCPVIVSPRRLERLGWCRTVVTNFALRMAYRLRGPATCRKLYERYYGEAME